MERYYVPDRNDEAAIRKLEEDTAICHDCGSIIVDRDAHDRWHSHYHERVIVGDIVHKTTEPLLGGQGTPLPDRPADGGGGTVA